ncbi:MAG: NAD(+)/NADH kinase, partial [Clostridiaceae bacterium]|nr:NAD(+)/NADH kinase [Clostridiaceae bacterium]
VIGVVANKQKDNEYVHTIMVLEKLIEKGFETVISQDIDNSINLPVRFSDSLYEESDFVICIGGDGTFLKVARQAYVFQKPVLGINKGTVGFLAEVEVNDIDEAIDKLSRQEYRIEPRMVLKAKVFRNGEKVYEDIAINDVVVSRAALSRIVNLKVSLDDKYVDTFPGDGIIVSTPTGSTGYTLSAGGPIIQPDMRLMIISPICPHSLYSRSFIASEKRTVKINMDHKGELSAMLTLDGQEGFKLKLGDEVYVETAEKDVLFASVTNYNFYDLLRAKLRTR